MATTIKLKNGSGAPLAGDLVQGEPALDLTNKRLYTEDSGGTVIEVGTNPGTDVTFADNRKAIFGASSDLQIYHDGSHSRIDEQGTGVLFLQTNGTNIQLNKGTSENMLVANVDGSVDLYFDNAKKLATTSTGIDVTGTVTSDKAIVGYSRAAGTGGIVLYDDDQAENRLSLITGGGTGINAVINQAGGSLNITDASLNAVATFNDGGNVGIGTASPANELVIKSAGSPTLEINGQGRVNSLTLGVTASESKLFENANTALAFGTNATERMRIDSSGNLLVGTTNVANSATVPGHYILPSGLHTSTRDGGAVRILNRLTSDGDLMIFRKDNVGVGVIGTQNWGIGTTSPQELLHLRKDASAVVAVKAQNNTTNGIMEYQAGNDADNWFFGIDASDNFGISDVTGQASQKLVITQAGNVGIGTSSPARELVVYHATQPNIVLQNSTSGVGVTDGFQLNFDGNAYVWNYENSPMLFGTNNSERMRIDSSGNLLVGTTSTPSGSVGGAALMANNQIIASRGSAAALALYRPDSNGDVALFHKGSTQVGSISVTGAATAYNTSSDVRLKENIVDAPAGNIDDIRVRSFDWKADGSHQTYGMVAQELVDVAPEAVSQGETEDDMWAVDYSKLVPMMIKEIQDLKAEVAALKGA